MTAHRILGIALMGLAIASGACSNWPTYRRNAQRTGNQTAASDLSDPAKVPSLAIRWSWQVPDGPQAFYASPIIARGKVLVGNGNGRFYALDVKTGKLIWEYPPTAQPALTSNYVSNNSSRGIASSAVQTKIGKKWAVIFGAPDKSLAGGNGSGRLFALDLDTGAEIWKSPELARLSGTIWGSTAEFHEQIGYSAPMVMGQRVYIGIADHGDNPIQNGAVIAVDLATGTVIGTFSYHSTSTRGGGVWSSVAGDGSGVYVTTGNTKCWNGGCQSEPSPNHGLSMLRLDLNGGLVWKLQPVPFDLDDDPDWAAGPTVMSTSCGVLVASVMKDGWAYAVEAGNGTPGPASLRWQFPPSGVPFTTGMGLNHGDTDYKKPGAAWNDVYIVETGGWARPADVSYGYSRLHALNACASHTDRVRWILDVPHASGSYGLGAPVVTGGIVYVGTSQGYVVAIADPSVSPAAGWRCADVRFTTATCVGAGSTLVPIPTVLAQVAVNGGMWNEAALAKGRLVVATQSGYVHMLTP